MERGERWADTSLVKMFLLSFPPARTPSAEVDEAARRRLLTGLADAHFVAAAVKLVKCALRSAVLTARLFIWASAHTSN